MRVFVNGTAVDVLPSMTVRHALISAGLIRELEMSKRVYDEWGNEIGMDGALHERMKIYVK